MAFADDVAILQAQADEYAAAAQDYLNNLLAVTNVVINTGLPVSYNYASVPTVQYPITAAGVRPSLTSSLTIPAPPDSPQISFSSLTSIDLPADDLLAPTATFAFAEAAYDSTLLDPLKAKLLYDLTYGGYGIEVSDEIALVNRARDREVEIALTRIDDAGRTMASRGFPVPPGELSIHVDKAWQDMQNKVSGVSRDITLQRNKLYVENRQFTLREVKDVEQILIGFHNSVQERALNVAKFTAEFAITLYNALLAKYKLRFDAAKITSEVQLQQMQTEVARANAYLEAYRGQIAAYEANLRRIIDPAKLQVEVFRADIDLNRVVNDAYISKATLQQKVIEATVQQNIQISQVAVNNARVRLDAEIAALQVRAKGAEVALAKIYGLLTGVASSANTLAVQSSTV